MLNLFLILIIPLIANQIDASTIDSDDSINVILELSNKGI